MDTTDQLWVNKAPYKNKTHYLMYSSRLFGVGLVSLHKIPAGVVTSGDVSIYLLKTFFKSGAHISIGRLGLGFWVRVRVRVDTYSR